MSDKKMVKVFICPKCGFEDSSFVPFTYKEGETSICRGCNSKFTENHIKELPQGDCLTIQEYYELIKYIHENHSFKNVQGKCIKYISHVLDFRTLKIHSVTLDDKKFNKVNENGHRDMKKWIYDYLNS